MTPYVALLRAVNVAGKNRLPMSELRRALTARGLGDVSTILQSGNVLFRSGEPERAAAAAVAAAIEDAFALQVGVVVRSAGDLAVVASQNPFIAKHAGLDPSTLHVAFLAERPTDAAVATLEPDRSPPDAFVVSGREVYLSYPNGSGRSRLTLDYLERRLGTRGTARNWRTVQRLADALAAA